MAELFSASGSKLYGNVFLVHHMIRELLYTVLNVEVTS